MARTDVIVEAAECACCAANPDPTVPPLRVALPRPQRMVHRRVALLGTMKASAVALLTACAGGSAAPTAAPTTAPAAAPTKAPAAAPATAPTTAPAAPTQPAKVEATKPAATQQPAAAATPAAASKPAGGLEKVQLAFCSQVLCILPYEVARRRGIWEAEGLDVELIYMRGGAQAMNALLAGSMEWVGTPMDLVVQGAAKGKPVVQLASTARLPFFAMVAGPSAGVASTKDLAGKKIGIGNLGTTDHLLAQFLLRRAGVDPSSVEFVALGPNLYDLLLKGEVHAGMVQEPGLTLLQKNGGKVLVNFMSVSDAKQYLGGNYQFMGLNTRPEVLEAKTQTAQKLVRGLVKANKWILGNPGAEIIKAAPSELVAGGDIEVFAKALDQHKADLYPGDGVIDEDAVQRVIDVQAQSGVLKDAPPFKATDLFTNKLVTG